ncbi:MAG: hypothetical protein QM756_24370 [Polyangiaceae bacterium]
MPAWPAPSIGSDYDVRDDHALLAAAIGVNAGAVFGMFTAGDVSPSIARVRYLDLGAIGGGLTLGGLFLAAGGKDTSASGLAGSTALGVAAGLATAWYATRGMTQDLGPETAKQASLLEAIRPTIAPTSGGALLALQGQL